MVLHDVGGWAFVAQLIVHKIHGGCRVLEEAAIAGAQVVETLIAVGITAEAVARTFPMTGEAPFTLPTLTRQGIAFGKAEGPLAGTVQHA